MGIHLYESKKNIDQLYIDELCPICLTLKPNTFLKICRHTYCNICVTEYFIKNKTCIFTCPICRINNSYDKLRIF